MKSVGKHSRTLHLEGSDESLAMQDLADLGQIALAEDEHSDLERHALGWSEERRERVEHIIEEIREIR